MAEEPAVFRMELSAGATSSERRTGMVAHFALMDGRQVDVHVPRAVACSTAESELSSFRIQIWRPDHTTAAVITATDLVEVFGARTAVDALVAFAAGDLPRALRLARRAGSAWRGLVRLLRDAEDPRRAFRLRRRT